jgi:hypothetical protein
MKLTRNQTLGEKLVQSEQADRKLFNGALLNVANLGSGGAHLSTLNGIFSVESGRKQELPKLGGSTKLIKASTGLVATISNADRLYNLLQSSSPNQVNTTKPELLLDIVTAGLSGAGGIVNVIEAVSGKYIAELLPIEIAAIIYGLAGATGVSDSVRTAFQAADAKANILK